MDFGKKLQNGCFESSKQFTSDRGRMEVSAFSLSLLERSCRDVLVHLEADGVQSSCV